MDKSELNEILILHKLWLDGAVDGARADLSGVNLKGINLREVDLSSTNLREADLREADLSWADLRGADLREANLSEANLRWANLRRADLRGADLSKASLIAADLRKANLRGANLKGSHIINSIGEGERIKTFIDGEYILNILDTGEVVTGGCTIMSLDEWLSLNTNALCKNDRDYYDSVTKPYLTLMKERLGASTGDS